MFKGKRAKGETSFTKPFFPKGKKGVMDDMFDFLFTVMALFFLLLFVSISLNGGINEANKQIIENVAEFNRLNSAVNHLKTQSIVGLGIDPSKIDEAIKNSKVLGGRIITNCADYFKEEDCDQDRVGIHTGSDRYCRWNGDLDQCELGLRSVVAAKPGKI